MPDAQNTAPKATVDKAAKFKELAEARTTKALNAIATLRGLSNKTNYEYTPEQASKIIGAMRAEIEVVEKAFNGVAPTKGGFAL